MPKITFIGAGSVVFTKNLLGDILSFPELAGSHVALMDVDGERLRTAERVAQKVAQTVGAKPTISAHTDRREALDGANYVINTIQVGGYKPGTVTDFEIPKKYGLRQTIADTLGIGGIMRGLRTIPVVNSIAKDIREVGAAGCQFLNYTNPMAMLCWAVSRAEPSVPTVGLCHSVQGTAHELARDIGIPDDEITYLCAGINHVAFYLRFQRKGTGEDLYPLIREVIEDNRVPAGNRVRYEMLRRLGYFVTESSEHFSEYCPHFIRRDQPELIEKFNVPLDEYIRRCIDQINSWEKMRDELEGDKPLEVHRSMEYGSLIIHSKEANTPRVIYGNVPNHSLIDNLPEGCCVEVPCLVDGAGVQPTRIGALPPQLAAIMQTNINVQSLTVEAALTGRRDHIYHAAMLDPHTTAELNLDQIWSLVDDLIEAHGELMPHYD